MVFQVTAVISILLGLLLIVTFSQLIENLWFY